MGASIYVANEAAEHIERKLYDGINTQMILQMIFQYMRKYKPAIRNLFDLRRGISIMEPKPEFEMFVQILLSHSGFEVKSNQILKGKCSEHEVDGLAKKDGITYFVEAKHHFNYHALTGIDESRIARAILEDVNEGFTLGTTNLRIDRALIVTNTRYSEKAIEYGTCRNILQIGWNSPQYLGIKDMVEKGKLYPLSCLRELRNTTRTKLVNSGIVLIKQLLDQNTFTLAKNTGLTKDAALELMENAKASARTLWEF